MAGDMSGTRTLPEQRRTVMVELTIDVTDEATFTAEQRGRTCWPESLSGSVMDAVCDALSDALPGCRVRASSAYERTVVR